MHLIESANDPRRTRIDDIHAARIREKEPKRRRAVGPVRMGPEKTEGIPVLAADDGFDICFSAVHCGMEGKGGSGARPLLPGRTGRAAPALRVIALVGSHCCQRCL
jgi:hypothetical protein